MKDEQKIVMAEIYAYLRDYVSNKLTPKEAVELYCIINKKWGTVEYDKHGNNPVAIIKKQYK